MPLARPESPSIPWRAVVIVVLAKASWDAVGLLAGDVAYAGPSYDVLRSMPPAGGMRLRGVLLAVLTAAAFTAAYQATRAGRERPLRICLSLYAVWYMGWAFGLASSWLYHGRILSWSAPASVLVVAVLAVLAARGTPRQVGGD
ncbi:hypothetical protein KBX50_05135 [Micromonospora sp. C51]|uniref:hypothetical protein n=1 Tax=Micromonospora sp. C51 TaxID=2824879 RepID=UPI001B3918A2|nr:hypothetical protein [Micromonospora sp. C51]MBQ1047842.1 hypothetical protein [Micromonospora sp. C51]